MAIDGVTPTGGADPDLQVEIGYGPPDEAPDQGGWHWYAAGHNQECDNCFDEDEWIGNVTPQDLGHFPWSARVRYRDDTWIYCDRAPGSADGWSASNAPSMDVRAGVGFVTVNVDYPGAAWDQRLPMLIDELLAVDPDYIAVQEIDMGVPFQSALYDLKSAKDCSRNHTGGEP